VINVLQSGINFDKWDLKKLLSNYWFQIKKFKYPLNIYHKNMGEPQRGSSSIIMAFTEAKYHKFPRIDSSKGRTWSS